VGYDLWEKQHSVIISVSVIRVCFCAVKAVRVPKSSKASRGSPDAASPQKVEGLRNRVKKSSIEMALELRAKRDVPRTVCCGNLFRLFSDVNFELPTDH